MLQWSTQNEGEDPSTLKPAQICTSALGGESVNSGQEMLFPYWLLSRWTWTKFSYLFFWHNQKKGSDSTPIAGSTLQVSKLSPQGASSIASCCAARFLEQTNFFPGGRRVFHRMTVEVEEAQRSCGSCCFFKIEICWALHIIYDTYMEILW